MHTYIHTHVCVRTYVSVCVLFPDCVSSSTQSGSGEVCGNDFHTCVFFAFGVAKRRSLRLQMRPPPPPRSAAWACLAPPLVYHHLSARNLHKSALSSIYIVCVIGNRLLTVSRYYWHIACAFHITYIIYISAHTAGELRHM